MDGQQSEATPDSSRRRRLLVAQLCLVALVAGGVGYTISNFTHTHSLSENREQRLNSTTYAFINPLLDKIEYESDPLLTREVDELKRKVDDITKDAIDNNTIINGSVYYRDLNNGPWFDAGERAAIFKPASLFKIPVMIAYFKKAETDPGILEKKILYDKPFTHTVEHLVDSSSKTIVLGNTYTVLELIEYMIVYSDNLAAYLLLENIDNTLITQVFNDLSIPYPDDTNAQENINPRRYASFFRIMYNATYLNRTYSEMALEILSRSSFKHGIRAALAPDTRASLKYGIGRNSESEVQLHECGIVYWHKDRPHLLCIMSIGTKYEDMATYLKEVTTAVQRAVTP